MNPHIQELQKSIKSQLANIFLAGNDFANAREIAELFKEVIDVFVDFGKKYDEKLDVLHKNVINDLDRVDTISDIKIRKVTSDISSDLNNLRKTIADLKTALESDIDSVRDKIPPEVDLEQVTQRIADVENKIPKKVDLTVIENQLRSLDEELKKLDEKTKNLDIKIDNKPTGRLGMRKVPIIKRVRLTDQVDGVARSFNLPKDTVDILGLWGTSFPITFDTADWTLSGNTLTLATAIPTPESGQTLMALVETLFYG